MRGNFKANCRTSKVSVTNPCDLAKCNRISDLEARKIVWINDFLCQPMGRRSVTPFVYAFFLSGRMRNTRPCREKRCDLCNEMFVVSLSKLDLSYAIVLVEPSIANWNRNHDVHITRLLMEIKSMF